MTSYIAKIAWKALLATDTNRFPEQGSMAPGVVHSIIRWAKSSLDGGRQIYTADVVDAFWSVRRHAVMKYG